MEEQIINSAFTESDVKKLNSLMQQLAQATDTIMRVRIAFADILQGAIARHEQIEAQAAKKTDNFVQINAVSAETEQAPPPAPVAAEEQ